MSAKGWESVLDGRRAIILLAIAVLLGLGTQGPTGQPGWAAEPEATATPLPAGPWAPAREPGDYPRLPPPPQAGAQATEQAPYRYFLFALGAQAPVGQFASPGGVAVAPDGTVYVADSGNHRIQAFGIAYPATWRGEYFANRWLAERPVLIRQDSAVDFQWGTGSPAPGVPADNFS